jgi:hypothetical protein
MQSPSDKEVKTPSPLSPRGAPINVMGISNKDTKAFQEALFIRVLAGLSEFTYKV